MPVASLCASASISEALAHNEATGTVFMTCRINGIQHYTDIVWDAEKQEMFCMIEGTRVAILKEDINKPKNNEANIASDLYTKRE